jgi:thiamine biosynthesis protein ThiS
MQLTVNGKAREVEGRPTLLEFLEGFGLNPALVAVEHNAEIIRRERFAEVELHDGDQLEIIHMVGGG